MSYIEKPLLDDSGSMDLFNEFTQDLQRYKSRDSYIKTHTVIVSNGDPKFNEYLIAPPDARIHEVGISDYLVLPSCLLGSDEPVNYWAVMKDKMPLSFFDDHLDFGRCGFVGSNLTINKKPDFVHVVNELPAFFKLSACGLPCIFVPVANISRSSMDNAQIEAFKAVICALEKQGVKTYAPVAAHGVSTLRTLLSAFNTTVLSVPVDIDQHSDDKVLVAHLAEETAAHQQNQKPKSKLSITNMHDIQAQAINWLWVGWLPLGKITILAGAGGCGKTNLLLALIATISTGGRFPDGSKCENSGRILIYSTEDDAGDTLKPRLMANGADLSKIDFIAGRINEKGEKEPFDPTKDLPLLCDYAIQHPDIKLIMIDPIISAIGGDSNKATDVRRSLQVLIDFANEFNCAVVGITHFAKGTAGSTPSERIIGSQAFTALARMVWSAAKREDEGDCILVRAKSNISTLDGGVRYKLESEIVGDNIETTRTAWLGLIEGTARELLNDIESTDQSGGSAIDEAKKFLIDILSHVDSLPSKEVISQYKEAGLSKRTIERASADLNIKRFKHDTAWNWKLPDVYRDAPEIIPTHKHTL